MNHGRFPGIDNRFRLGIIIPLSLTITGRIGAGASDMDRFEEMRVFVRIAERQSFTRASDDLQIPRATVTNLMKRMEQRLGARLLERTTRTVRLTHDGEAFYRRCVRLIADMEEAEGSFSNLAPKG